MQPAQVRVLVSCPLLQEFAVLLCMSVLCCTCERKEVDTARTHACVDCIRSAEEHGAAIFDVWMLQEGTGLRMVQNVYPRIFKTYTKRLETTRPSQVMRSILEGRQLGWEPSVFRGLRGCRGRFLFLFWAAGHANIKVILRSIAKTLSLPTPSP